MDSKDIYVELVQILKLIASSSEKQIQIFPDFVEIPDEIALVYGDIYLMVPQIVQEKLISVHIVELLTQLDQLFDEMSKDPSLWSIEYFEHGELWNNVRQLACLILGELNERNDIPPDINFIQWIKSN